MDLRFPLACFGFSMALLAVGGCSPDDEHQQASLEQRSAAFEQSLDGIKDQQLKDAVADLGGSLLLLERARLKLQDKPIETEYGADDLALLKHYPSSQALTDTYINGLFVLRKASSSDYLTDLEPVFPFPLNSAAEFPFPHALEWQSVTLSNKQVVPFQPEWSESDPGIQLSPSSANLSNPDDLTVTYPYIDGVETANTQQPQPMTLQGKVEVIAPGKVVNFNLTAKDVGKTRTDGTISVTLLALGKNFAEVDIVNSAPLAEQVRDTPLNPLIIQARDASGQFLTRSGSINENAEQLAFYQQQLAEMLKQTAWSDAFEQQLDNEQKAFDQLHPHHYSKVFFNGTVANVDINVLDFSSAIVTRKALDLPVRMLDKNVVGKEIQPLALNVVVYDDQAANALKDATLAPEQLEKSVVISQSVEDASAASLEFSHPATFNSEMLGALPDKSDAPVTFFAEDDKGNRSEPLELPAEAFDVDPHAGVITYDLNLFPETPAYAVGSIPLFIADIDKQVLDIAHLPKGLELKGNALIVDQNVFPAEAWRFFAKDDTGNYLKEVTAVSHSTEPDGPPVFDVHYFYGQPTQLESYARTALNPVEYGFEVKLDKAPEASTPR
ncbi:hypothetical protein [Pseudomonas fragi]|uniref:hypothetical protein n=1 Tax=Pseudomonas fragi TaxID=296 RepID=UPI0003781054|nr:hypothetical protein [Pseudomonas fragi]MDE4512965.1 hypothetical protein [Pseudomonas fragi]QPC35108.1 hypothetical protein IS178_20255 [Pseudomonas fragi]SDU59277.1 hypothetical protein SAMN05216594_3860 [Pseudomonas fragi]